jgi:hypothetical protein
MADPLLSEFPLPLHRRLYPLGFPLDVFTNSDLIVRAAEQSWAEFAPAFDCSAVTIRIGVAGPGQNRTPAPPVYRSQRNLLCINSDNENFGVCDLSRGFAFAWVNQSVAENGDFLRYFFIEAIGYILLSAAHLVAVHAACIERNGRGVLLCGDSGAGKSSLAYACARRGWTYVCDDASFLVRDADVLLVTGNPYQLRLRDTAPVLFPEFAKVPVTSRPEGKPSLEIPTRTVPDLSIACQATISTVLFLERQKTFRPSLTSLPQEEALRRWNNSICYGDEESRFEQRKTLQRLLEADIHTFRYSELDSAVAFLNSVFASDSEKIA